jgi:hypothetical protein
MSEVATENPTPIPQYWILQNGELNDATPHYNLQSAMKEATELCESCVADDDDIIEVVQLIATLTLEVKEIVKVEKHV